MKILILCNKSPYPTIEGGPLAMNSIVNGLLDAGQQVKILAVNSKKYNVTYEDIPEDYMTDQELKKPQPPLTKAPMRDEAIDLPHDLEELEINNDFLDVINRRRSLRV